VRDCAAATLPEGVLVQFLADPLGLQRVFAGIQWPEDRQRAADQIVAREDVAQADNPLVDQHDNQGVDTVIRAQFITDAVPLHYRR